MTDLYLQEQLARIRIAQAESDKFAAKMRQLSLEEPKSLPLWQVFATLLAGGAACFAVGIAAGAALVGLLYG